MKNNKTKKINLYTIYYAAYFILIIFLNLIAITFSYFYQSKGIGIEITKENGIIESLSAIILMGASIKILLEYKKVKSLFYLLWASFFFILFLEEISWGQSILNFEAPLFFLKFNHQGETNLHNLIDFRIFNTAIFQMIYLVWILFPSIIFLTQGQHNKIPEKITDFFPLKVNDNNFLIVEVFLMSCCFQLYQSASFGGKEKYDVYTFYALFILFLLSVIINRKKIAIKFHTFHLIVIFLTSITISTSNIFNTRVYEIRELIIIFGIYIVIDRYLRINNSKKYS